VNHAPATLVIRPVQVGLAAPALEPEARLFVFGCPASVRTRVRRQAHRRFDRAPVRGPRVHGPTWDPARVRARARHVHPGRGARGTRPFLRRNGDPRSWGLVRSPRETRRPPRRLIASSASQPARASIVVFGSSGRRRSHKQRQHDDYLHRHPSCVETGHVPMIEQTPPKVSPQFVRRSPTAVRGQRCERVRRSCGSTH
jgi:hypothetical protein